jgi:hypothetical protein
MVQFHPLPLELPSELPVSEAPDFMRNTIFLEKQQLPLLLSYITIELAKYSDAVQELDKPRAPAKGGRRK